MKRKSVNWIVDARGNPTTNAARDEGERVSVPTTYRQAAHERQETNATALGFHEAASPMHASTDAAEGLDAKRRGLGRQQLAL